MAKKKVVKTETEKVAKLARPGKYVYYFGDGKADGDRTMKDLLGGKGSGLAEMTNAKLPVPAGFTISTPVCTIYYKEGGKIPASIDKEMIDNMRKLEKSAGRKLGDTKKPLLVSVRSGAKFSMPGMMDTILNLGLNDQTVESLKRRRATAGLPPTAIGASSRCSGTSSSRFPKMSSSTSSTPSRNREA